jgi:hypothetical protein
VLSLCYLFHSSKHTGCAFGVHGKSRRRSEHDRENKNWWNPDPVLAVLRRCLRLLGFGHDEQYCSRRKLYVCDRNFECSSWVVPVLAVSVQHQLDYCKIRCDTSRAGSILQPCCVANELVAPLTSASDTEKGFYCCCAVA